MPKTRPLAERFWTKVKKTEGCWLWIAFTQQHGYGMIARNGKAAGMLLAHRVSWLLEHGAIPDGLDVLHTCDNPSCVRPAHLFLGTHLDNMRDKVAKGRQAHNRGTAAGNSKLDDDKVRAIRRDTRSQRQIARAYGVDQTLIGLVKRRKIWAHVDG